MSNEESTFIDLGKNFENHVASIYEGLGYEVSADSLIGGQQVDIDAKTSIEGVGLVRCVIECKYRSKDPVSNQEVQDFVATVTAIRASESSITKGIMVTNSRYSRFAKSVAENVGYIELTTARKLEESLFDMSVSYRSFTADYESTEIFANYLPLGAARSGQLADTAENIPNIEETITHLIENNELVFLSILGDYGSGKTTLMERVKYVFAKKYLQDESALKPILIPLKAFFRLKSIDALLYEQLKSEFGRNVPLDVFWRGVKNGQFILLLDGFDEMAPQVDAKIRTENLLRLSSFISSSCPCLLTCRPSYFVSDAEYDSVVATINAANSPSSPPFSEAKSTQATAVRDLYGKIKNDLYQKIVGATRIENRANIQSTCVSLESLSPKQIDNYLRNFDSTYREKLNSNWKAVRKFLSNIYDLSDLMKRPILLTMINETVMLGRLDLKKTYTDLGPSSLYELYTSTKLELDWHKGASRRLLMPETRVVFSEAIAWSMFQHGRLEVNYDEILSTITAEGEVLRKLQKAIEGVTAETVASDIQTCGFLTRAQDGVFRFAHRSFMEFFVARHLKNLFHIQRLNAFSLKTLPQEILYFLGGFGIADVGFRTKIKKKLKVTVGEEDALLRSNLAGVMLYSGWEHRGIKVISTKHLKISLSKTKFRKSSFRDVTFQSGDILSNRFWDSSLERVNFTDALVKECQFKRCSVNFNILRSLFEQVRFKDSIVLIKGRDFEFVNPVFRKCSLSLSGRGVIQNGTFSDKKVVIPPTPGTTFNLRECTFENLTFIVDLSTAKRALVGQNCKFKNCLIYHWQLTVDEIVNFSFENCRGIVFVTCPASKDDEFIIEEIGELVVFKAGEIEKLMNDNDVSRFVKNRIGHSHFTALRKRIRGFVGNRALDQK